MKEDVKGMLIVLALIGVGVMYLKSVGFPFGYALPVYRPEQTDWR